jgi:hypothetical protein
MGFRPDGLTHLVFHFYFAHPGHGSRPGNLGLFDGFPFHFDNSPAWLRTRHTLDGLTATMSASSIMNLSRR